MRRSLCVITIVLSAAAVHAQTVVQHDDQTVTVRAESVPIATLISEIARVYPIERVTIQPGLERQPVSIVLERVAPASAVVSILKASGLDFALSGRRIVAGDWTASGKIEPAPNDVTPDARLAPGAGESRADRPQARDDESERRASEHASDLAFQGPSTWGAESDETTIWPTPPVPFVANGENITYLEPNFVPYKMRPHVRGLRMAIDVTTIP